MLTLNSFDWLNVGEKPITLTLDDKLTFYHQTYYKGGNWITSTWGRKGDKLVIIEKGTVIRLYLKPNFEGVMTVYDATGKEVASYTW